MPCILKVRIEEARDLPPIERTSDVLDAYVEIRIGKEVEVQRTAVCRRTLDPVWNEDFRFEISDDSLLQDEPLELKVYDFDPVRPDDSVGSVTIELNPLLSPDAPNQLAGWFPIYDTIWGCRGELLVQVKIEFFENINPFKESSAGVHLFSHPGLPPPYKTAVIVGLVDAVITEVDPDYHWSDSFRSSRSSNEASQKLLHQLSCRIKRQLGKKALEMGADSILGYCQWFDIESYSQTITVRALGTAAILDGGSGSGGGGDEGGSISSKSPALMTEEWRNRDVKNQPSLLKRDSGEVVIGTIVEIPSGVVYSMGGMVSAKSIKLISEEADSGKADLRDQWLTELREEIKGHARSLGCNIILGYRENITIGEEVYLLSVEGTACRIQTQYNRRRKMSRDVSDVEEEDEDDEEITKGASSEEELDGLKPPKMMTLKNKAMESRRLHRIRECSIVHLPRRRRGLPTGMTTARCNICRRAQVSEFLLSTISSPSSMETFGMPLLIEAQVVRPLKKKKERPDVIARAISNDFAFVEYELYRQLQFKARFEGFNAIFGLSYHFLATDKAIVAIASGTGMCLAALPKIGALQISRNIAILDVEDEELFELQKRISGISLQKHEKIEHYYEERFPSVSTESSDSDGTLSSSSTSSSPSSNSSSADSHSGDDESIVQIDDEADEDLLLTMFEYPEGIDFRGTLSYIPPKDVDDLGREVASYFICRFRRFALDLNAKHSSSLLSREFSAQYEDIANEARQAFTGVPTIMAIRHQMNVIWGNEWQIVTTGTILGFRKVSQEVSLALSRELLSFSNESVLIEGNSSTRLTEIDTSGNESERHSSITTIKPSMPNVHIVTCSSIPNYALDHNCGTLSLQLFKEIYRNEGSGGFLGFVTSVLHDLFYTARASAIGSGGNALTCVSFKPAAFYENFKSQLHAVVFMTADVIKIEGDSSSSSSTNQNINQHHHHLNTK